MSLEFNFGICESFFDRRKGVALWQLVVDFGPLIVNCGDLGLIFGSPGIDCDPLRVNFLPLVVAFWPVEGGLGCGSQNLGF